MKQGPGAYRGQRDRDTDIGTEEQRGTGTEKQVADDRVTENITQGKRDRKTEEQGARRQRDRGQNTGTDRGTRTRHKTHDATATREALLRHPELSMEIDRLSDTMSESGDRLSVRHSNRGTRTYYVSKKSCPNFVFC